MNNIIMEYEKIINLLDNTSNQPSKFRTKNWVEIIDDSGGMYNTNSQIKFKTSMLKTSLCDCSDAYILVRKTIAAAELAAGGRNNNVEIFFYNHKFTNNYNIKNYCHQNIICLGCHIVKNILSIS